MPDIRSLHSCAMANSDAPLMQCVKLFGNTKQIIDYYYTRYCCSMVHNVDHTSPFPLPEGISSTYRWRKCLGHCCLSAAPLFLDQTAAKVPRPEPTSRITEGGRKSHVWDDDDGMVPQCHKPFDNGYSDTKDEATHVDWWYNKMTTITAPYWSILTGTTYKKNLKYL